MPTGGMTTERQKGKNKMMIDIDKFEQVLDDLAAELPDCFFERLNGGIIVSDEAKVHPDSRADDLYILGEYRHSLALGRDIVIYYGSFVRTFGDLPFVMLKNQMRKTLRHEFRHHVESLSGEHDLEVEDGRHIVEYLARFGD